MESPQRSGQNPALEPRSTRVLSIIAWAHAHVCPVLLIFEVSCFYSAKRIVAKASLHKLDHIADRLPVAPGGNIAAPQPPALTEIEQPSIPIDAMFVMSLYSKESFRAESEAAGRPRFNRRTRR